MKKRLLRVLLGFWFFTHLILFIFGWGYRGYFLFKFKEDTWDDIWDTPEIVTPVEYFYPFNPYIEHYDVTEFLIYGVTPILLYLAISYVKGRNKTL